MNILNKLTIKHLKMNKKRTIVTIIGIILSTALMVGIGTFASSFREFLIEDTINHSGSQHVIIGDVKYNDYKYIKENI
ncbi:MAG: ABC transporter permease, partial [Bacilli bacterium]